MHNISTIWCIEKKVKNNELNKSYCTWPIILKHIVHNNHFSTFTLIIKIITKPCIFVFRYFHNYKTLLLTRISVNYIASAFRKYILFRRWSIFFYSYLACWSIEKRMSTGIECIVVKIRLTPSHSLAHTSGGNGKRNVRNGFRPLYYLPFNIFFPNFPRTLFGRAQ